MNINYNYYRIFYYVAKYQNITAASAALMNSQSNITRSIKALEDELGCTLFVRSNRGVALTPEGESLFSYVRVAIEQLEAGEQALTADTTLQSGTISIGTSGVALGCFLMPILQDFQKQHPKIRLRLSNHSTPQAVTALKNGAVEVALVTSPIENDKQLIIRSVKTVHYTAVCGPAFADAVKHPLTLKELAALPIISLGPHTKTYDLYTDWFLQHGLHFSPEMEAYTSDQIMPLVKSNLGIGFVPKEFLTDTDTLIQVPLTDPPPSRSVCFLKRSGQALSAAAKELERMIDAAAQ